MGLKTWLLETRPQFLLLSVILVIYGTSIALYQGYFDLKYFLLTLVGLIFAHIAVNVLNDYFDFKSGLDLKTQRTPFSGGSGILPAGLLEPKKVYAFGIMSLVLGLAIGLYLVSVRGIALLPLIVVGAIIAYFYTTHLTKYMLGELSAGLGLGCLPVIGSYFVQTGHYSLSCVLASIPAGILTANLLLLNEIPDYEADKTVGRRTIVTMFGKDAAVKVYAVLTALTYATVIACIILGFVPVLTGISLATIPIAVKGVKLAQKHYDVSKLIPALANNVKLVLGTQFLIALGFLFSSIRF